MSLAIENEKQQDLAFLTEYCGSGQYKNYLQLNGFDTIEYGYGELKQQANEASGELGSVEASVDASSRFSTWRDYTTRYASRYHIYKTAIDKKIFYDMVVLGKIETLS